MYNLPDKTSEHEQDARPLGEEQECEIMDIAEQKKHEINKMFVIFFEMRILFSHPKIRTLFLEFGHNTPKYLQYEGGSNDGMTVVCCVDSSIDAESICLENCVRYSKLHEIEIDKMMYNNSHCVHYGFGDYNLKLIKLT
jgi:hypothetical protein